MKILFLPINVASVQPITAEALNHFSEVEAKCFSYHNHKYLYDKNVIHVKKYAKLRNPFNWIITKIKYRNKVKELIKWADVIHYSVEPAMDSGIDLVWAKKLKKKVFIEFLGSEIRNPEVLQKINKYYKSALSNGYEYKKIEESNNKVLIQQKFSRINATAIVNPEMSLYIDKSLFPNTYIINLRIFPEEFTPVFSFENKEKIKIVHLPSALVAKGTNYINPIVEKIKEIIPNIDYVLLHNRPRVEVLKEIQSADIVIDQIILGSYGMASIEAMAFGKPTLCYLMPQLYEQGLPQSCPIVNVNVENLEEKIIDLSNNPDKRHQIGIKSRKYVEEFHNAHLIAGELLKIYTQ